MQIQINIKGYKKFRKKIKNYFLYFDELFEANCEENLKFIDRALSEAIMNYSMLLNSDNNNLTNKNNLKFISNQIIVIISLINCNMINKDYLDDNKNLYRGKILASVFKLIEFEESFYHNQVTKKLQ